MTLHAAIGDADRTLIVAEDRRRRLRLLVVRLLLYELRPERVDPPGEISKFFKTN